MSWATWLAVLTVAFFLVLTPGPNMALVIRNCLAYSRETGRYTVLGVLTGSLVHITYCLAGIGLVIAQSVLFFNTLKWIGALYLGYLGVKALFAGRRSAPDAAPDHPQNPSPMHAYRMGLLSCLLNPKAAMFFLALFTQVIQPDTPLYAQVLYGLTMVFMQVTFYGILTTVITNPRIQSPLLAVSHWVERASGAVFILFGLRLAFASRG